MAETVPTFSETNVESSQGIPLDPRQQTGTLVRCPGFGTLLQQAILHSELYAFSNVHVGINTRLATRTS